jgi:anti-anti-sigma factor
METCTTSLDSAVLRLTLGGHLDATATGAIEAEFAGAAAAAQSDIIVDMTAVSYLSAAATKMLISVGWTLARGGRRFVLFNCPEDVADLLEIVVPRRLMAVAETELDAEAILSADAAAPLAPPRVAAEVAYLPDRRAPAPVYAAAPLAAIA